MYRSSSVGTPGNPRTRDVLPRIASLPCREREDRAHSETASFRLVARYGPLAKTLRRRACFRSPVGASAGPSGGATVRLTWQNQGKRDPTPQSRRTVRTMITANTVPLRTHPTPLVRQQAVERGFSERKRNRRFRDGT